MVGVLAAFIAAALVAGPAGADDEAASIKGLMGKLHKGATSPLIKLKTQLKAESPDWPKIQAETRQFVNLGASLSRFDPPRGETSGYKALATNYYNNAKVLDAAASKEDAVATKAAFSKLSGSCKECHTAHKGN
jgi:hypothetical protein